MDDIVIMNFSSVYKDEDFYKDRSYKWLNCSDVEGTNCYCNRSAEKEIKNMIASYSPKGVHFIDSGNYHYVSKFWVDKIKKPFILVLFDNHSDMMDDLLSDMLSCGNWLKKVMDDNANLKKVVLFGPKKIPADIDKNKIIQITKNDKCAHEKWTNICKLEKKYPVYISIDKDVIDKKYVKTSWDQGKMEMKDMERIIDKLATKHKIIGIDICGEYNNSMDSISYEALKKNNKANKELLNFIEKEG